MRGFLKKYEGYKDKKDKIDKILNPVPPQPVLKKIGGDFYATPPIPQRPNYDEPFGDALLGIDFDIVYDGCNIGIQLTGTLFFMKLPSFQFVWRNPACTPRKNPFKLPDVQATSSISEKYWELKYRPYAVVCTEDLAYRRRFFNNFTGTSYYEYYGRNRENKISVQVSILSVSNAGVIEEYRSGVGRVFSWYGEVVYSAKISRLQTYWKSAGEYDVFDNLIPIKEKNEEYPTYSQEYWTIDNNKNIAPIYEYDENLPVFDYELGHVEYTFSGIYKTTYHPNTIWTLGECLSGDDVAHLRSIPRLTFNSVNLNSFGAITPEELPDFLVKRNAEKRRTYEKYKTLEFRNVKWTQDLAIAQTENHYTDDDGIFRYGFPAASAVTEAYGNTYIYVSDGTLDNSQIPDTNFDISFQCDVPEPPAPLPPMKKECCDELLSLIALLLKRVGDLPAFVPDNFTKKAPQIIKKESLAELMLWQAKQLDAISGKYPIEVEIQDIDPVKKGNQSITVNLPNQAELLADMYQAVLMSKQINEALLPIVLKTLSEVGSVKLTSLATHDLAFGNADFLGWDISHTKDKVKFQFNPIAEPDAPMEEMLEPTEVEVKGYENKDKKDLRTWLIPIARMAAAWMAQNFRKVPNKESFRSMLGDIPDLFLEKIEQDKKENKENKPDEDFDVFIENVEKGFIGKPGITDTINPYGKPFEERPKIREFGGEDSVVD
jgi:hypothetical protein